MFTIEHTKEIHPCSEGYEVVFFYPKTGAELYVLTVNSLAKAVAEEFNPHDAALWATI